MGRDAIGTLDAILHAHALMRACALAAPSRSNADSVSDKICAWPDDISAARSAGGNTTPHEWCHALICTHGKHVCHIRMVFCL